MNINASPEPTSTELELPVIGTGRLGSGWRLLIYLVLASPVLILPMLRSHTEPANPGYTPPHFVDAFSVFLSEILLFAWVVFCTFVLSRIERRRITSYGLDVAQGRPGQFLAGLFWGVASMSLLVGVLWKMHLLLFDGQLLHGGAFWRSVPVWLGCFLLVALFEDFLMRGYLQFILTRVLEDVFDAVAGVFSISRRDGTSAAFGFWTSAVLLSFLFGLGHSNNPGESPLGLISAGLAGLVFCLSLWRTGSLWWAVGFHCSWDWAQSFLYGVADSGTMIDRRLFATHPAGDTLLSGGTTGPEGSLFVLPVVALVAVVIVVTLPRGAKVSPTPPKNL